MIFLFERNTSESHVMEARFSLTKQHNFKVKFHPQKYMSTRSLKLTTLIILSAFSTSVAIAQKVREPKIANGEWTKPYKPFRIAGNLYYVGTYELASYLITTPKGNILINTGLASSAVQIKNNIRALGFKFDEIKILLTTQAHYDHMGAMATVKKQTHAKFLVDEGDAEVLKDGGNSDYALGGHGMYYAPVKPDRLLKDGDTISLGNMQLILLHHPGHTKGSCSYLFTVRDEQRSWDVLIANMPTIVTDSSFARISNYPGISEDYARTFKSMRNISFDIWLSSHASQFEMHTKHASGNDYRPAAFADRAGYDAALQKLENVFNEKVKKQLTNGN
jgi:metallo-beta-lactamase class B